MKWELPKISSAGNLTTTGPEGEVTELAYDSLGRKYWMRDPDMGEWFYEYDERGNLKCQVDMGGQSGLPGDNLRTCSDFDALNRVVRQYDLRNGLHLPGDSPGNCLDPLAPPGAPAVPGSPGWDAYVDSFYSTVHFAYDQYPAGLKYHPGANYNSLGALTAVYNRNGSKAFLQYVYEYDSLGRAAREQFLVEALRWTTAYQYNLAGQLTQLTYPDGSDLFYDYDNVGAVRRVYDAGTVYARFGSAGDPGYNSQGQTTAIHYGNGVNDTFAYYDQTSTTPNFRLKRIQTSRADTGANYLDLSYHYTDVAGRITPNVTAILDPEAGNQVFAYDFINRLVLAEQTPGASGFAPYGTKVYAYTPNGNILGKTEEDSTDFLNYSYDPARPHAVTAGFTGAGNGFTASYNHNGSMTAKTTLPASGVPSTKAFAYDAYERIISVIEDGARVSDSFYHLSGERLFEGVLADHFVEGTITISPLYDLKLSSGREVYLVKHILAGDNIADVYDSVSDWHHTGLGCGSLADRLAVAGPQQIILGLGVLLLPGLVILLVSTRGFRSAHFRKHPLRNTVIILVTGVFAFEMTLLPEPAWDAANPMFKERLRQSLAKMFVAAYAGREAPVSVVDESQENPPRKQWLGLNTAQAAVAVHEVMYRHIDHLGSVRVITDKNGDRYQRLDYKPFGKLHHQEINPAAAIPAFARDQHLFTGQVSDAGSGLYYFGARYYDPEIGRFLQVDPIVQFPFSSQSFNGYSYIYNNPLNGVDPTGYGAIMDWFRTIFSPGPPSGTAAEPADSSGGADPSGGTSTAEPIAVGSPPQADISLDMSSMDESMSISPVQLEESTSMAYDDLVFPQINEWREEEANSLGYSLGISLPASASEEQTSKTISSEPSSPKGEYIPYYDIQGLMQEWDRIGTQGAMEGGAWGNFKAISASFANANLSLNGLDSWQVNAQTAGNSNLPWGERAWAGAKMAGQAGLSVGSVGGANYAGRSFYKYTHESTRPFLSSKGVPLAETWLTRGWGYAKPYSSLAQATDRLALPSSATGVERVSARWYQYVAGPARVTPEMGRIGGGWEYQVGGFTRRTSWIPFR